MKQLENIKIKNPVWLAASHLTENVKSIKKCCEEGAGAIVLKGTDGRISQPCDRQCQKCKLPDSFQGRRLFVEKSTIYSFTPNSLLCEFLSLKELRFLLNFLRENYPNVLRVTNISAKNPQEFLRTAKSLKESGAQALELNTKYTLKYRESNITDIEEYLLYFLRGISKEINSPLILKVCPNYGLLEESFLEKSSQYVNGFTITNGLFGELPPHFKEKLPRDINKKTCSVIGEPLWELVKKYAPIAKNYVGFVSASGGIYNSQRAKEIISLGADSVQLCSGIEFYGYNLIKKIAAETISE